MPAYKTPNVYVEEISTLPPSVAEVSTAIPAFLGYTQKNANVIARISTLFEYEAIFGGPAEATITAARATDTDTPVVTVTPSKYYLYHALSHYFDNGGGACYIVSVGAHASTGAVTKAHFEAAITSLEKEDEPTLVVLCDAINLGADDYYSVCTKVLSHCHKLGDRFAILDIQGGNLEDYDAKVAAFRNGVGMQYLDYGAAYHPHLRTTLNHHYTDAKVDVVTGSGATASTVTLEGLRNTKSGVYLQIQNQIDASRIVLPPSAAIAGIYAAVDRNRGVWKAPANVSLSSVIAPTTKITNDMQTSLNVDPDAGKSINAIRAFPGKGTLVWGARTLAGNDNEWRYVPFRRLFLMIEESARKATGFAVFEPNDMTTWLKVKGMIESFLYGLWERGALAGPSPEAAYFVNVGLGKTMTTQDVLEGRMIVKIGVAAVRPAEFIILQFTHKLQEA